MVKGKEAVEKLLHAANIRIGGEKPFDIQVHDDRFYKKVLSQRELGIGEAYVDGWWSSGKLDETITRLLTANIRESLSISPMLVRHAVKGILINKQNQIKAYKNASAHYDIGNDLYSLMLGKRMIYSCGFWQNAKNLDEAQEAKLDRIC